MIHNLFYIIKNLLLIMGKMPAGLRRYWAARRRKTRKGGRSMAKRRSRSRGYGKRFARRAGSLLSKPAKLLGFKGDGFHVSDAVIAGGVAATALLPAIKGSPESSPVGIMLGRGAYAGQKIETRMINALNSACINGLGVEITGQPLSTAANPGIGGMAVGAGVAMKIGAKFVNPFMRGSLVKL